MLLIITTAVQNYVCENWTWKISSVMKCGYSETLFQKSNLAVRIEAASEWKVNATMTSLCVLNILIFYIQSTVTWYFNSSYIVTVHLQDRVVMFSGYLWVKPYSNITQIIPNWYLEIVLFPNCQFRTRAKKLIRFRNVSMLLTSQF